MTDDEAQSSVAAVSEPGITVATERIEAASGIRLGAQWTLPDRARALVVVHGATAVPQSYYGAFAHWLATHGFAVFTYDYSGVGASRLGSLRAVASDFVTWTRRDFRAAMTHARASWPELPLVLIGHSLGGQAILLDESIHQAEAIVLLGAGSGYWRHAEGPGLRARRAATFYLGMPLLSAVFGFLPAWVGLGEGLPGPFARSWAARCRTPSYFLEHEVARAQTNLNDLRTPVLDIAFTDDDYIGPEAVRALLPLFGEGPVDFRALTPAQLGVESVGHFAGLRPRVGQVLWPMLLEWIEARLPGRLGQ
jgi:predicted alpha/beta hydrolase